LSEKDLKDVIKSKALSLKRDINKFASRKIRSNSDKILADHFEHIELITKEID
jgi:hypothetical protein